MSTIRRILVAVKDTQHMPGNALHKAAALARTSGATIESSITPCSTNYPR